MSTRTLALACAVGLIVAACGEDQASTEPPDTLTIISHDSFSAGVTDDTFAAFTEDTGIEVEVLPAGDAGSMTNQAILTADNPVADVLFGVDDTFLGRALANDIFVEHRSPALADVADDLDLDPRVTPIDYGDVCLNYDVEEMPEPPASLADLTTEAYAGTLVVESPATSSPGLAFLLATIDEFGEDGWQDYWRDLVANDVLVVADWDTAYYGEFTQHGGDRPLVVSYASSPPAEVLFAETELDTAPTATVAASCYRQIEFAGVLAGSGNEQWAAQLVDFMLSPEFQEQIPLTWFVYPANTTVALPDVFAEYTAVPDEPLRLDPTTIEENRERWIDEWTEIVLP